MMWFTLNYIQYLSLALSIVFVSITAVRAQIFSVSKSEMYPNKLLMGVA